jgi:protein-disulfide isomerase
LQIPRPWLLLLFTVVVVGCHVQTASVSPARTAPPIAPAKPLAQAAPSAQAKPTALDRRVELTVRSQFNVPPEYAVVIGKRSKSAVPGFDTLPVTFNHDGGAQTMNLLISTDNNTLAHLEKFDLSKNPLAGVPLLGRPVRGSDHALVTVVDFDDLECPYCALMQAVLFPETEEHYKDQVRYIDEDYPLTDIHPWAMHAAVDVNCMAAQSKKGYWNLVDYIHGHGDEITGKSNPPDVKAAMLRLDQLTRAEGKRQGVKAAKLDLCISKQNETSVRASMKAGTALDIDGTPTLFINGERVMGVVPQSTLWAVIDRAIVDAGGTPPPEKKPVASTGSSSSKSVPAPKSAPAPKPAPAH